VRVEKPGGDPHVVGESEIRRHRFQQVVTFANSKS
jgi:hypothetical protein